MIKHIVLWTFKDDSSESAKQDNINTIERKIWELKNKIPGILKLETGKNVTLSAEAYDLALYCEFENLTDLEIYQKHPAHLALVELLKNVRDKRAFIDYEV